MPSRVRTPHLARLVVAIASTALMLAMAVPAGASGGANDPPGWSGATPGEWVAFTVSPTTATPIGRTGNYEPVTITRDAHLSTTSIDTAFGGWPMRDTNGDTIPDERGWPDVWSDGSVTLTRVDWCTASADSCAYQVTDPGPFHFAAGEPPVGGDGQPDYSVFPGVQTIQKAAAPELNIVFSWSPATNATPAAGTTPGRLTLDASAVDGLPGDLVFDWTVIRQKDLVEFAKQGPTVTFDLDQNDVYCVSVKVTNTTDNYSKTYGAPDCQFVDGVAPQVPASGGGSGGGTGGVGGVPVSAPEAAPTIVFAPPRKVRSALTGGGGGTATDSGPLWLWRPEWFVPSTETQTLPQTGGRSRLQGRKDIVVSSQKAPESDASPMLAGLGAFGLIGIGWVLNQRRKVRAEY
jgi:hypothetical protein